MLTEDQAAVIEFPGAPSAHGLAAVERIDPHSAIVFLAGERAYKFLGTPQSTFAPADSSDSSP